MRQEMFQRGGINRSIEVMVFDATTGLPASIPFNEAGIAIEYWRRGAAAAVPIALSALAAYDTLHADGGWIAITEVPGAHRLDLPDAATADAAEAVVIGGATTDHVIQPVQIQLTAYDPREAAELSAGAQADVQAAAEAAAQAAVPALLVAHDAEVTGAVVDDVANSATTFEVDLDVGTDVRVGVLRLTIGALAAEARLVSITGTQVTVLSQADMPTALKQFSAEPADAVTFTFRPIG